MNIVLRLLIISIVVFICLHPAVCDPNEKRLLHHLFDVYNQYERPTNLKNETLIVSVSMKLQGINYVYEPQQRLATIGILNFEWIDVNLRWESWEFGDVKIVSIARSRIYIPDVYHLNENSGELDRTSSPLVVVRNNGSVVYSPPSQFFSNCKISLVDYPFEEHDCELKFGSYAHNGEQIDVQFYKASISEDLIENPIWKLIDFSGRREVTKNDAGEPWPLAIFTVKIKRNGDDILSCAHVFNFAIFAFILFPRLLPYDNRRIILVLGSIGLVVYSAATFNSEVIGWSTLSRLGQHFATYLKLISLLFMADVLINYITTLDEPMPKKIKSAWLKANQFSVVKLFAPKGIVAGENNQERETVDNKIVQVSSNDWNSFGVFIDRIFNVFVALFVFVYAFICFPKF